MLGVLPDASLLVAAFGIALAAGVIKGIVGFSMPLFLLSGLIFLFPPQVVIGALVVPSLVTNAVQALRQGPREAARSLWKVRLLFGITAVTVIVVAQFVPYFPERFFFMALGVPVILFTVTQLAGWRPEISSDNKFAEALTGFLMGVFGGMANLFGPPIVVYLTAVNTPKAEQVRIQGVVFTLGVLFFAGAHYVSGVFRTETLALSTLIAIPALIGTYIGFRIQDRVHQDTFRILSLCVLFLGGANLIRRALMG